MALNPFFLQGSQSEQRLVQDLINEQLKIYGVEVSYLPRRVVNQDTILNEIQSSKFSDNFSIEAYVNTYEGYDGDAWGGLGGGTEVDTSVNGTTAVGVGSFAVASHRSASIRAQIDQGANYQVGRYLMIHDGTTVTVVEEAAVATGDMLGSFTGDINNSNAELKVTMASSGIATVTTIIDKITI